MKKWCWTCTAKAGFAVGLAAIFLGRHNPYVSLLAVIFSLASLIMKKREQDKNQRAALVVLASIGLTLGLIMLFIYFFTA